MSDYVQLTYGHVAMAAIFLCLNGAISIALGLGLAKKLAISAVRMAIQLVLVGLILKTLFDISSPWLTLAVALIMGAVAGREVLSRQETPVAGLWGYGIGTGAMVLSGGIVLIFALTLQIDADPWYSPRYALPLFGMILGNAMTGVALGLETLTRAARRERPAIEARLALGATRWEALRPFTRQALATGFMPSINAMAATGVVSLPGMMTGQILAGIAPTEAVKYQLMIMFLIAGSTGMGVLLSVLISTWRLTDTRHRLRLDRLTRST
ncbi:putative ABC transport system permease protein [Rhodobium orientis]|uniref:Iron export ABC transporter permease subunit FetB n=1 Tax=Rhodobium orientis TaxID=34017 RepID=A0A327JII5_9HYPH|nr:iron export ABC transporter permease subunit FetB [Rhodobium orientis]MBB4303062.1 putative ABC transport system permease protein [Rhodobium orientis]MBK5948307.1 iron export ABC transporter permease subunit FetB [Rhodobium orientis]RAI25144.1 iron export ABC transporter permease subunit FetB [Rhodobium orientis]